MNRRSLPRTAALLALLGVSLLATRGGAAAEPAEPPSRVGNKVNLGPEVQRSLGQRASVVVFLGTGCPVANAYIPCLNELAKKYEQQGVRFIGVNANSQDSAGDVAKHARAYSIAFPVLKDDGQYIANALAAERVPEAVLLDAKQKICYRGRIDDRYGVTSRREQPTRADLAMAIDELLAGKPISVPRTEVSGCLIGRDPVAAKRSITYCKEVSRIIQNKCQVCHRDDGAAPFALATYAQARAWAGTIREVIVERRMPPWHADPHFGKFANDRSLTQAEIDILVAWIDAGTAKGNENDLPAAITFPKGKWTIGTPDVVLAMPKEFGVPAQGVLPYQDFIVETNFQEERWIERAQVLPGSKTVHHAVIFLQGNGDQWLCTYVPGESPLVLPPGTAKKIPAGAKLRFNIHYTPSGKAEPDRTSLGLIFAKQPPRQEVHHAVLEKKDIQIPAGAANHREDKEFVFRGETRVLSLFPHMHVRGKSWECRVLYPDGRSETVLKVPRYDFNWQHTYRFVEPLVLPAGSKIQCIAHYDNSKDNPANPDPSKVVKFGPQTWDEMMVCGLEYLAEKPNEAQPRPVAPRTLERLPREQTGKAAQFLAAQAARLKELPLATELDADKACGLAAGPRAALVIPTQHLSPEVLSKATRDALPIGQLWFRGLTLPIAGKIQPPEALRIVPVAVGNQEQQLLLYLLGIRKNADGALELVIYAQGKEPVLTLPIQEAAGQQSLPLELSPTTADSAAVRLGLLGKYQVVLPIAAQGP